MKRFIILIILAFFVSFSFSQTTSIYLYEDEYLTWYLPYEIGDTIVIKINIFDSNYQIIGTERDTIYNNILLLNTRTYYAQELITEYVNGVYNICNTRLAIIRRDPKNISIKTIT